MKAIRISTIAAVVLGLFGAAHAADAPSTSRAQVAAELAAEQAAGTFGAMGGEDSGSFHLSRQPFATATTRRAVSQAVIAPETIGAKVALLYIEERGWSWYEAAQPKGQAPAATLTRREVAGAAAAAVAGGEADAIRGEDGGAFFYARAAIEALPAQRVAGAPGAWR